MARVCDAAASAAGAAAGAVGNEGGGGVAGGGSGSDAAAAAAIVEAKGLLHATAPNMYVHATTAISTVMATIMVFVPIDS